MAEVSISELRRRGTQVIDMAILGESITITRGGQPVAEVRAAARETLSAHTLLSRWASLPEVDPVMWRADFASAAGLQVVPVTAPD